MERSQNERAEETEDIPEPTPADQCHHLARFPLAKEIAETTTGVRAMPVEYLHFLLACGRTWVSHVFREPLQVTSGDGSLSQDIVLVSCCSSQQLAGSPVTSLSTRRQVTSLDGAGIKGRGKWEIPEKTRRPRASYGTMPTCESPVTRPGIEPATGPFHVDIDSLPQTLQEQVLEIENASATKCDFEKIDKTLFCTKYSKVYPDSRASAAIRLPKTPCKFTCSEYWDTAVIMGASSGQAPCMLHVSNDAMNVSDPPGWMCNHGVAKSDSGTLFICLVALMRKILNWRATRLLIFSAAAPFAIRFQYNSGRCICHVGFLWLFPFTPPAHSFAVVSPALVTLQQLRNSTIKHCQIHLTLLKRGRRATEMPREKAADFQVAVAASLAENWRMTARTHRWSSLSSASRKPVNARLQHCGSEIGSKIDTEYCFTVQVQSWTGDRDEIHFEPPKLAVRNLDLRSAAIVDKCTGADSIAPRRNQSPTSPSPLPGTPLFLERCARGLLMSPSGNPRRRKNVLVKLAGAPALRRITRVGEDSRWWPKTLYILPQPSGRQSLMEAAWRACASEVKCGRRREIARRRRVRCSWLEWTRGGFTRPHALSVLLNSSIQQHTWRLQAGILRSVFQASYARLHQYLLRSEIEWSLFQTRFQFDLGSNLNELHQRNSMIMNLQFIDLGSKEIHNHEIPLVQHFYIGTEIKVDPGSKLGSFDLGSGKMLLQPGIRGAPAVYSSVTARQHGGVLFANQRLLT
ncbi:hypothetical protein PR048_031890 [Dryococelus australis]|uniref:Uncharacterized protein n=1 Tax=Dryococelus australis TaxID=614101 RepID=A0ABQ9GAM1_9NEOP|nr:hypothetical protein PR048_031890 [Dryococelus australis]